MTISVSGKRVIVTGGARGIAASAVRHLAKEGALVASFDIRDELGQAVADESNTAGPGKVTYYHVDVSDFGAVKTAVAAAAAELGGVDALLNIAGIDLNTPAETITETDWTKMLDVNVKGVAFMCQAAFPYLKGASGGGGSIVNFASDAGLMAFPPGGAHYSAAKSALFGYTRTVAGEWGKHRIRINCLNPAIKTPQYEEHLAYLTPELRIAEDAYYDAAIPLGGELGNAETDLAPVLEFLVSDASKFITSQIICVNGGLISTR